MPGDFFDSNVLLYVTSSSSAKAERAEALIRRGGAISVQVLNEVAHVARRKFLMEWREIAEMLAGFRSYLLVHDLTLATHNEAIRLVERHRLAWYDSVIAAAALIAGCDRLYSEDMRHGLVIDGRLRIENPFLA